MLVVVTDGNDNFNTIFSLYSPSVDPIVVGTDALDFARVGGIDVVFPNQANAFLVPQQFDGVADAPIKINPLSSDPSSPLAGDIWINNTTQDFKFVDGVDAIHVLERTSRKNVANGYPGLNGSSKITGSQQTYGTSANTATEGNDTRVPTQSENDALVGTNGTPSSTNTYVTDEGRTAKYPVRVATTGNITLSGTQTIDGVSVVAGDRVLVKNQGTDSANGIYVVAAGAWSRATDFNTTAKVKVGSTVSVAEGTTNNSSTWMLADPTFDPVTVGTDIIIFALSGGVKTVFYDVETFYSATQHFNALTGIGMSGRATDAGSPAEGDIWHNTTSDDIKFRSGVVTHVLERTSRKNVADGYAGLDGSTKLSGAQQTYGTASNTAAEGDDVIFHNGTVAFSADQSMGGFKLTNLGAPTAANDAARKTDVDTAVTGVDAKDSAVVATTANITLSGEQTIDGVLTSASRVLVKNQSTASGNGLYLSAAGAWTRTTDTDTATEISGMFVWIQQGTTNANTAWVLTTDDPITLGSTSLSYTQFAGPGVFTAGDGIDLTGNQFDVVVTDFAGTGLENDGSNNLRIAAAAAGDGLTGGGGSALAVNPGSGIEIVSDAVRISTAAAGDGLTGGGGSALAVSATAIAGTGLENDGSNNLRIAASAAGNGLGGGGGSALSVNVDATTIVITADTLGVGVLAKANQHAATVYNDQANTYTAGSKQTVAESATTAGLRLTGLAGNPSGLSNGDLWHNTTTSEVRAQLGGTSRSLMEKDFVEDIITWTVNGTLSTGTAIDGGRIARKAGTILAVTVFVEDRGSTITNANTIADINLHASTGITTAVFNTSPGTSIYATTPANRPTLAGLTGSNTQNGVFQTAAPDTTSFSAGNFFTMDIDAVAGTGATTASGLVVMLHVRYTS
jgi:hypothetical protein